MDHLTGGKFTEWDIILEWNVIRFLNTLSYIKDKQAERESKEQLEKARWR